MTRLFGVRRAGPIFFGAGKTIFLDIRGRLAIGCACRRNSLAIIERGSLCLNANVQIFDSGSAAILPAPGMPGQPVRRGIRTWTTFAASRSVTGTPQLGAPIGFARCTAANQWDEKRSPKNHNLSRGVCSIPRNIERGGKRRKTAKNITFEPPGGREISGLNFTRRENNGINRFT